MFSDSRILRPSPYWIDLSLLITGFGPGPSTSECGRKTTESSIKTVKSEDMKRDSTSFGQSRKGFGPVGGKPIGHTTSPGPYRIVGES